MALISYISIPVKAADGSLEYVRVDLVTNEIKIRGVDKQYYAIEQLNNIFVHEDQDEPDIFIGDLKLVNSQVQNDK